MMYAYNPRKKTYPQLKESLVGDDRWETLRQIQKELTLKRGEVPKQHWMIVGPRGMGKSHLLTLLYHKVTEKLKKKWIVVLFPEELRMANNLAKFLERAAKETYLELVHEDDLNAPELNNKIKKVRDLPASERVDYLFSVFTWLHEITGRHILFITENLQQLMGKKLDAIELKKLRAYLQTSEAILLICSATTVFEELHDHKHPFYHFFHIKRLEDLDFESMKLLIIRILSESSQPEKVNEVINHEARLKAIHIYAGGNPRLAVFLSKILQTEVPDEMMDMMDDILDDLTPYFDAILNDMPDYQEEILNTLAEFEPAQSPKEIADHLEIPQATVRNYIKHMKENGYVRIAFSKGKSNFYCLSEYLYRIWYQMRDSSHREEARWLMELLVMLHSPKGILEEAEKVNQCNVGDSLTSYSTLINQTVKFISTNPDYCKTLEACIDSMTGQNKEEQFKKIDSLFKTVYKLNEEGKLDEAIDSCKEILNIAPNLSAAYGLWGQCLLNKEKYSEAIEKFRMAAEKSSDSTNNMLTYQLWGICLFELGKIDDAIKKFKKALKVESDSDVLLWWLGACLREKKLYKEAIEKFDEAIQVNKNCFASYGARGDCLRNLKKYEDAEKSYRKSIEINIKYFDAYFAWGQLLEEQKKFDEAINLYQRVLKIHPNSIEALGSWGACLINQNNYDDALEKFRHILDIDPNSKEANKVIAKILLKKEKFNEAINIFETHFSDSNDCVVLSDYGRCLLLIDRFKEAVEQFEKVINIWHSCNKVYFDYGVALIGANKEEKAIITFVNHIRFNSLSRPFIDLNFDAILDDFVTPILKKLKSDKFSKSLNSKDKKLKYQSATILMMMGKYDVVETHFGEIITKENIAEYKEDYESFVFSIKLCLWLKISEGNSEAIAKLTKYYIKYIATLEEALKEKEVSNLMLGIFKLQLNKNISSQNITEILALLSNSKGVPYNEIFNKIGVCIAEQDTIKAKKYLNEKGIADTVKELMKVEEDEGSCC